MPSFYQGGSPCSLSACVSKREDRGALKAPELVVTYFCCVNAKHCSLGCPQCIVSRDKLEYAAVFTKRETGEFSEQQTLVLMDPPLHLMRVSERETSSRTITGSSLLLIALSHRGAVEREGVGPFLSWTASRTIRKKKSEKMAAYFRVSAQPPHSRRAWCHRSNGRSLLCGHSVVRNARERPQNGSLCTVEEDELPSFSPQFGSSLLSFSGCRAGGGRTHF